MMSAIANKLREKKLEGGRILSQENGKTLAQCVAEFEGAANTFDFYAGLTDEQQDAVDEIYGDKGIMAGYNPVSMFGKGAAGAIDTRIGNIMQTLQRQALQGEISNVLEERQRKLQAERDRITGTIRDASGTITGGSGQGTIDSGNTGGYGGTGGEGPSAVSSSGMLGGGV